MAGSVVLTPTNVPVVPGTTGTCSVRIRNTGVVVDQFSISVLGQPAAWTTAVPAVLSLFPGAEGTIELHFAPPRTAEVGSGPTPFGVRVDASQDPEGSVVEEGEVDLLAYTDLRAKITPRTSEAKRKARHEVLLDNRGNTAVEADLSASDPDEVLAFELSPRTVTVPAGGTSRVAVNVAAREGFLKGPDKQRPFQVRVLAGDQPAVNLDATLLQKAGMPRFILPLAAAAVAAVLLAVMLPALKKDSASGKLNLASEDAATTTTAAPAAAPAGEEPADPNAPATAEEAAAAAEAEKAANGKDAGSDAGAGSGGGAAAGGGATEAAPTTAPPPPKGDNDLTEKEAPPASAIAAPPPSTTTTAAPAGAPPATTTTTAPQPIDMYYVSKQENDGQAHYHYVGGGTVGQTFRANAPVITEVWFNLSGNTVATNLRVNGPGGAIVASMPATSIVQFGWTKIVFAKPVTVTTGSTYYLEGVMGGSVYAWYSNTNDYASGDGFFNGAAHGHDLNARVIGRTG
jgi:hypothetical protein